jgi:hypothetical protein
MSDIIGHARSVVMGLYATMNPVANAPIFLGLTTDDSPDHFFPPLSVRQWVPSVLKRLQLLPGARA